MNNETPVSVCSSTLTTPKKPSDVQEAHNKSCESLWDKTLDDLDQTVVENGFTPKNIDLTSMTFSASKITKPPPLPPKPKNLMANITKNSGYAVSSRPFQKSNGVDSVLKNDVI